MKRLLILLSFMAVLLVPQFAQAESFFAGNIFDDRTSMSDNLARLTGMDPTITFTEKTPDVLDFDKAWQFTAIGFSAYAVDNGITFQAGSSESGEFGSGMDGVRFHNSYLADDISVSFFRPDYQQNDVDSLKEIVEDFVLSAVYVLDNDVTFKFEDQPEFSFAAGTIFFGFSLPGGSRNEVDVIMAGPVAPAVPVPAAVWLMGTGVAGIVAMRRKMK